MPQPKTPIPRSTAAAITGLAHIGCDLGKLHTFVNAVLCDASELCVLAGGVYVLAKKGVSLVEVGVPDVVVSDCNALAANSALRKAITVEG